MEPLGLPLSTLDIDVEEGVRIALRTRQHGLEYFEAGNFGEFVGKRRSG
jgi:hypothetical protein